MRAVIIQTERNERMVRNKTCDRLALKIAVETNAQVLLIASAGAAVVVEDVGMGGRREGASI